MIYPTAIGAYQNQPGNTNTLKDTRFRMSISKLPKIKYLCQAVSVPAVNIGFAVQATPFNSLLYPAQPFQHAPLNVRFLVDEDLENYKAIWNWMKECVAYTDFLPVSPKVDDILAEDLTVTVLTNNQNYSHSFRFAKVFPIALGNLDFDATKLDSLDMVIDATFQYTSYSFEPA